MNLLSQIITGLTAVALISMGTLEIFFHRDQRFYRLFLIKPEDVRAVRMWAMNIGAYNIVFGLGMAAGLWMLNVAGNPAGGAAIIIFCCLGQVLLGIWLWVTEKRLLLSAIGQALFPGLAVLFYLLFR